MTTIAKVPAKMRCIEVKTPGGPEMLVLAERPVPVPKPGEVLIKVRGAGVNRGDTAQRVGMYPPPPGASDIMGLEVSGIIMAHGDGINATTLGAPVCALIAGGGYAEYATAPASSCLPIPAGVDIVTAGGLPETFLTVWHNVFDLGRLQAGETLLVHGGASGIGTAAIPLARALGAKVIATAGSDPKCAACRDIGADVAINYRTSDFVEVIRTLPEGGVDVILDMVGGDYTPRNLAILKPHGRLVLIALLHGGTATIDLVPFLLKRVHMTGSTLRGRDLAFKAALTTVVRERVWPLIERGAICPVVDSVFPLAQAADAHRRMEAGAHIGKIILTAGDGGSN